MSYRMMTKVITELVPKPVLSGRVNAPRDREKSRPRIHAMTIDVRSDFQS
jgi:hypothetical protein